jgi:hypothetical protein
MLTRMTPRIDPPRASSRPTSLAALVVIVAALTTGLASARWADAAVHLPLAHEVAGQVQRRPPERHIVGTRPSSTAGCLGRDAVLEPCERHVAAVDPPQ